MSAEPNAVVSGGPRRLLLRAHGPRLALGVGLAILTYALFPEAPATQIPIYEIGAVATDNVIAPFAYEVPKTEQELLREREDVARAAQPVFRLLGAKDLGKSDDYKTEKMPPVNVGLLDGQLAWRQHDGGHTDGPNWKYFIPWADRHLKHTPPVR